MNKEQLVVHIIPESAFTEPYINLINNNFNDDRHIFFVLINKEQGFKVDCSTFNNVVLVRTRSLSRSMVIIKSMLKSNKIILHGMFSLYAMYLISLIGVRDKTYCIMWGGDFYEKESKLRFLLKRYILCRCRGISMELEEDAQLLEKKYKVKCKYFPCMLYTSNVVDDTIKPIQEVLMRDERNYKKIIQVGNSAWDTNCHIEILEALEKYKDKICLFMPLAYGDKDYAANIAKITKDRFGDGQIILREILHIDDYKRLLSTIDVAIFGAKRQQGLGNIITLIGMGKKVYLRSEGNMFKALQRMSIEVYDFNRIGYDLLEEMSLSTVNKNITNIKKHCSKKKLLEDWKTIFNDAV